MFVDTLISEQHRDVVTSSLTPSCICKKQAQLLSTSQPLVGCFAMMGCHISQFSCNLLCLCCCDVLRYISPIPKPLPPLVCGFCQCLSNSVQKPLYCLTTLSRWAEFQFKQRLLSSPPNKQRSQCLNTLRLHYALL